MVDELSKQYREEMSLGASRQRRELSSYKDEMDILKVCLMILVTKFGFY